MKSVLRTALLIVLLPASTNAFAQSANMVGYGLSKCRDIVAVTMAQQERTLEIMQWVFGYLSGLNTVNAMEHGKYRDIGAVVQDGAAGGLTVPLLRGCRNNPDRAFADMIGEVYGQLPLRDFKN
ncbi:hypothetical protein CN155_10250 [Sinorhizobium meliloti]|uniref:hypothetical protein n=1 Tax=Rhizobium meliloti TaxID=382 RepID=UPI000FDB692E|nr:hypothetical protein [Sinorhizobium meliloti]MDE3795826.1 hypothetical protein [Sinorhizobium meliloti]RVK58244.1 hypothetical protein CN155_10250 [Sinorhizobium meliloti]